MNRLLVALIAASLSMPFMATGVLSAQDRPCADDVEKFCKDVKPGDGRLAKCLKEHEKDLSPACKARQKEIKKKVKEAAKACYDDVEQYCSDVQSGGGRIVKCLKEHESELSAECKEKIKRKK